MYMSAALEASLVSLAVLAAFALSVRFYRRAARRPTGVEEHSLRFLGCLLMLFTGWLVFGAVVSLLLLTRR
jgi:heme/copper-type cytochrome/quinol oxidase subunit 2